MTVSTSNETTYGATVPRRGARVRGEEEEEEQEEQETRLREVRAACGVERAGHGRYANHQGQVQGGPQGVLEPALQAAAGMIRK
jgi:hypothetical protein